MDRLTFTALALDASHERLGWGLPARLYGIGESGSCALMDEGPAYDIVDRFTPLAGEHVVAVALVCEGWCTPVDRDGVLEPPHVRRGRRQRLRTVVLVGRGGEQVAVLRRRGGAATVVADGHGALMDRLLALGARLAAPTN